MARQAGNGRDRDARVRRAARQVGAVTLATVVVAVPAVWVASLQGNVGLPASISEEGDEVVDLWRLLLVVATVVGMVVLVLFAVPLLRYRHHRRQRTASGGADPPQVAGSVPLELVYTAVPLVIVAGIFWASLQTSWRTEADDPVLDVGVTAFQWGWRFDYPGGQQVLGVTGDVPVLVLPQGEETRLLLRSNDVNHSFFVPGFITKRDLIPGVDNEITVTPTRLGQFVGHCAEYCGIFHARMNFAVRIVPPDEFEMWLQEQPLAAAAGQP